ncbi:MAG: M23 family metallopeptidase [Proteobacteria bacterium]|nr:M23 family metallopeptidase [Cystobacterineae bacterium]MCL2259099.1 M23 family metallopeptidase [Cystobacterineae bacterium]MCL2314492.1 M23 family metallopeptidase [Pseudomonadota bacterium]
MRAVLFILTLAITTACRHPMGPTASTGPTAPTGPVALTDSPVSSLALQRTSSSPSVPGVSPIIGSVAGGLGREEALLGEAWAGGLLYGGGLAGRGKRPLSMGQQAALWHALLTELDGRLKGGHIGAEEFAWLREKLGQAWEAQDKEGLPVSLCLHMKAFLERLHAHALPEEGGKARWPLWPIELSSPFGYRIHPLTGLKRFHQGVDLRATAHEEVRSIQEGWVLHADWAGSYGYMVEVLHSGNSLSRYAHLSQINVRVGQRVDAGTVVGLAGDSGNATGVHVHFELWKEGSPVDPVLHLP